MKRLLSIFLTVLLIVMFVTGCGPVGKTKSAVKIGLVTDVGGRGDRASDDAALRGLETWAAGKNYVQGGTYRDLSDTDYQKSLEQNAADLSDKQIRPLGDIVPVVLEPQNKSEYASSLERLAAKEKCSLVIAIGPTMADAVYQTAQAYPDVQFALIDAEPVDPVTLKPRPQLANLVCYLFHVEQSAFLAGAIAGMATKTGNIGYMNEATAVASDHYEAGFLAGIKTTNPTAYGKDGRNVSVIGASNLDNRQEGQQIARTMIAQACDILFQHTGATGYGMFAALKQAGGPGQGLWGIGTDTDMGSNPYLYPAGTLTSSLKHVDYAVYLAAASVARGTYKASVITLSMKDGGVGYARDHIADILSSDQLAKVDHLRRMIIDGAILPPTDPRAVAAWVAPTSY